MHRTNIEKKKKKERKEEKQERERESLHSVYSHNAMIDADPGNKSMFPNRPTSYRGNRILKMREQQ